MFIDEWLISSNDAQKITKKTKVLHKQKLYIHSINLATSSTIILPVIIQPDRGA